MFDSYIYKLKYYLTGKEIPEYWKQYKESLKHTNSLSISKAKFVVFDCETSGLDPKTDRILSMGAVTINDKTINVKKTFEKYLKQEIFKRESVAIHGLLKKGTYNKCSEEDAIIDFLKYIEGAILIGHHVNFDVNCVNYALKRMGLPKLKNKTLDTGVLFKKTKHEVYSDVFNKHYTLDEICDELKIKKTDRHTAYGDAYITAIVYFKILGKLNRNSNLKLKDLLYTPKIIY